MRNGTFRVAILILCAGLLGLTAKTFLLAQTAPQSYGTVTVIRAGTLIDGVSETPRKNQLIFVRGEKIVRVTGSAEAIPAGANVIDLSNTTVLPGLIDSHTHIFLWGEDPAKGGYDENILKAGIALRAARHVCLPACDRARIHHAARRGNGRCGLRGRRDQTGNRRRNDSRAAAFLRYTRHFHHGWLQSGRVRAGAGHA